MTCNHLRELESALIKEGLNETFRGQAWENKCREWVYFDCILDLSALRKRFALDDCVKDHEHLGTHDGSEQGFYCSACQDGVMGIHPRQGKGRVFR